MKCLTGPKKGVFKIFLEENLPHYRHQIRFVDDCSRAADLAILGLGLNGHVAFHEPGIDGSFYSGSVRLSEITCDHLGLERGTWGVSYGAGAFSRSRASKESKSICSLITQASENTENSIPSRKSVCSTWFK